MEMPLRIYTPYLDMTGEIDGYSSAQLDRNYHDVGEVEIHVNLHAHNADKIQQGSIITLGDSASKAMFVRHMEIELTDEGKQSEEWTIKGPTMQGLMSQRITVPPKGSGYDRKSGAAETVMKHYVRQNFIEAVNSKRNMKELLIAPDKERGDHVSHESRYKNVADELANISKESGLGWMIYIDYTRHKFVFDVVEGLDLTQDNEEGYDPVFFSPDFGTIKQQSFSDSDLELANHGYVAGQGEGKDRKVVEVGDKTGMNRFETFVDARDVGTEDEDEEELSDDEIEKMLTDRGKKKMQDMENELSLDAEILSPTTREAYEWKHDGYLQPVQPHGHYERKEQQVTPFVYERDFDLGDTVPVYNRKWGITMTARITKIKEIHEPGGFRLEATFGKERPTLVSKIRDNFNELNGIEKQEIAAQLVKKESKLRDDKLTQEQLDRIEQARKNLEEAKDYTYDKDTIDDKDKDTLDQSKKDAQDKANAAQDAAEKVADAKAKLAEENAIANADGKITSEEKKRIEEAEKNLKDAKNDAKSKSDAAEKAAKDYADAQDKIVAKEAREDAKDKADAAQSAAEKVAQAKADLAKTEAIADADGKITKEEKRAIQDAKDKLEEAKTDAKSKADAAEKSARDYAELKSKEAQEAAEKVAKAKADLAETEAKAHADDKITKEQEARINQAKADLKEAKAAAELAETQAKAYSDGKLSNEEKRAIKDAKDKLAEAKKHADDADKIVEDNAKKHTEDYSEQKIHVGNSEPSDKNKKWLDTSGSHDKWRRYNHDASDNDNVDVKWPTTDVIDKDTTFANEWLVAKHIESLNGLSVAGGQLQITEDGNLKTSGDITGAFGTFSDVNVKDGDFTLEDDVSNVKYSATPKRNMIKDHSFEMMQPGHEGADSTKHNWVDIDETSDDKWVISKNPKIVTQFAPGDAKALAIHGNRAIAVKDANFVRQYVYDGVGGDAQFTISGFFKRQWNKSPGKPRFEVDYIDSSGDRKDRLINEIFETVPDDYSVVRRSATFTVPSNFQTGGSLDVKISGGDSNWVQCDGVQMVEGDKPRVYQPEDSIWEVTKDNYKVRGGHRLLWSGTVYLYASHTLYPDKQLEYCKNGWVLEWSNYTIGDGATDSDWQYTYIAKNTSVDSTSGNGARAYLRSGKNTEVVKYFYVRNDHVFGHDSNGDDNRNMVLRAIYEW